MENLNNNVGEDIKIFRKRRAKKLSTHIDMTPMDDLMSLLITFFMLTTAFIKPKILEIVMPVKGNPSSEIIADRTLHLLLSANNEVYYYTGKPPENKSDIGKLQSCLKKTSYNNDGIRKTILNKNILLFEKIDSLNKLFIEGKSKLNKDSISSLIKYYKKMDEIGPIVMIKVVKDVSYRNIVDVVDEMAICNVARYAIIEPNEFEIKMLENLPR